MERHKQCQEGVAQEFLQLGQSGDFEKESPAE